MRANMSLILVATFIPCLVMLISCGSPPKPPTVDEAQKRPANSQAAIDGQVCKHDLQNSRIQASESSRLADTHAATLAQLAARQQLMVAMHARAQALALAQAQASAATAQANVTHTVQFEFGSARVVMPADTASALIEDAKAAPLVMLRSWSEFARDGRAPGRNARDRAVAVRDYLVAAGVDPARIRITYQQANDHVADKASPDRRDLNRRVEIEMYRALPVAFSTRLAVQP